MRLNRFIANSGICTRREADALISQGAITVNGEVVTVLGSRIRPETDEVRYNGKPLAAGERFYRLYNKPAGQAWEEMAQHHGFAADSSVHPLETGSCGLLLLTNDLALHTRMEGNGVDQLFYVTTAVPLSMEQEESLLSGVQTSGGRFSALEVETTKGRKEGATGLGIRYVGESDSPLIEALAVLGCTPTKVDRVMYEGLTKWDLPRGKSRSLEQREVGFLKMKK